MKKTYLRSKKELQATLDKHYPETKLGDENKPYFMMSQTGFKDKLYDSSDEIAVHAIISLFTTSSEEQIIKTHFINLDMIHNAFNIVAVRPGRVEARIDKALFSLEEKGIITIKRFNSKLVNSKSDYFVIEQNKDSNDKLNYFQLVQDDIIKIILLSESDNERFGLLASYATIVSQMNKLDFDKAFLSGNDNWGAQAALLNSLSFASAKDIAKRTKLSLNTSKSYVDKLYRLSIIYRIKVHKKQDGVCQWSYYYSKYSQKNVLIRFINILLFHAELPDNDYDSQYKDYSWLNIDDVWDPDVHK